MSDEKKPMRYKPSRLIIDELTGDIMLAREVDKYYDILLVEKDAKITELENLFAIQQTRTDKATKLWQEATGKTETLPDLGDLLDWLMEQSTEAKRVHREMIDLLEVITEESNETYPEMAVTDAVRLLKKGKEKAEGKLKVLETEISEYRVALKEAERKLREAIERLDNEGMAAGWYGNRFANLIREKDKLKANLKTATDTLKGIANIKYEYAPCYLFIEDAKKALADIEGEKELTVKEAAIKSWEETEPDIKNQLLVIEKTLENIQAVLVELTNKEK